MSLEYLRDPLLRSARARFLSLLLRPPAPGRRKELRELAKEIPFDDEDPGPLLEPGDEEAREEAFRLHGQAGRVPLVASDFVEGGFADKGPILADIAGFYSAFGYEPCLDEPPDHFAVLFDFVSFLALKEAWSLQEGDSEQAEIARDASRKLWSEHIDPYLGRFAARLEEAAPPDGVYASVARFARGFRL